MSRPIFHQMWLAFPDHIKFKTMKDLYTELGGVAEKNIYQNGFGEFGNTCASRISVAFNKGGAPISKVMAVSCGARTISAADGSQIIYGVSDLRAYLRKTLGKPTIDNTIPYDDAFRGRKGIVAFSVNWSGATGHIALWNGSAYREPSYDNFSSYVKEDDPKIRTSRGEFWEIA